MKKAKVRLKLSDWVRCRVGGPVGLVSRMAKDGSWADVSWPDRSKRMRTDVLVPLATIPVGEFLVTDLTREAELKLEAK